MPKGALLMTFQAIGYYFPTLRLWVIYWNSYTSPSWTVMPTNSTDFPTQFATLYTCYHVSSSVSHVWDWKPQQALVVILHFLQLTLGKVDSDLLTIVALLHFLDQGLVVVPNYLILDTCIERPCRLFLVNRTISDCQWSGHMKGLYVVAYFVEEVYVHSETMDVNKLQCKLECFLYYTVKGFALCHNLKQW